jgi:HK97 gp10 family phage protein
VKVKMEITNADEIVKRLEQMEFGVANEHLQASAEVGAEIICEDASGRVNTGPHAEHLKDHIVAEVTKERDGRIDVSIGPDKAEGANRDRFYGRLVEFGHVLVRVVNRIKNAKGRTVKRITKQVGTVPPHPFMRPALDTKRAEANQAVADELKRRLGL